MPSGHYATNPISTAWVTLPSTNVLRSVDRSFCSFGIRTMWFSEGIFVKGLILVFTTKIVISFRKDRFVVPHTTKIALLFLILLLLAFSIRKPYNSIVHFHLLRTVHIVHFHLVCVCMPLVLLARDTNNVVFAGYFVVLFVKRLVLVFILVFTPSLLPPNCAANPLPKTTSWST